MLNFQERVSADAAPSPAIQGGRQGPCISVNNCLPHELPFYSLSGMQGRFLLLRWYILDMGDFAPQASQQGEGKFHAVTVGGK